MRARGKNYVSRFVSVCAFAGLICSPCLAKQDANALDIHPRLASRPLSPMPKTWESGKFGVCTDFSLVKVSLKPPIDEGKQFYHTSIDDKPREGYVQAVWIWVSREFEPITPVIALSWKQNNLGSLPGPPSAPRWNFLQ